MRWLECLHSGEEETKFKLPCLGTFCLPRDGLFVVAIELHHAPRLLFFAAGPPQQLAKQQNI